MRERGLHALPDRQIGGELRNAGDVYPSHVDSAVVIVKLEPDGGILPPDVPFLLDETERLAIGIVTVAAPVPLAGDVLSQLLSLVVAVQSQRAPVVPTASTTVVDPAPCTL